MLRLVSSSSTQASNDLQQSGASLIYDLSQQFASAPAIQAEAVSKCNALLDNYPFPTFVNALFGRLADLFVADHTTGYVRLQILKTFEQSHRHLNKLSGVNLLFDKIFQVAFSTDDTARAITLRLLSHMNTVIPAAKADIVRHKILSSMDSKSDVELNAALFAASKFSKFSVQFSRDVFAKLLQKFQSVNTDSESRIKLSRCLIDLEYDDVLFKEAVRIARISLEVTVDRNASILLLESLSTIALSNFVYVPEVSSILCQSLTIFSSNTEKMVLLKCFLRLTSFAHLWEEAVLQSLAVYAASKDNPGAIKAGCFHILLNIYEANTLNFVLPPLFRELAVRFMKEGTFLAIYGSLIMIRAGISAGETIRSSNSQLDLILQFQYCITKFIEFRCFSTHKFLHSKLLNAIKVATKKNLIEVSKFIEMLIPLIFEDCLTANQFDFAGSLLSSLLNVVINSEYITQTLIIPGHFSKELRATWPYKITALTLKLTLCCSLHTPEAETRLADELIGSNDCIPNYPWQLYQLAVFGIRRKRLTFSAKVLRHVLQNYCEFLSLASCQFLKVLLGIVDCHVMFTNIKFSFQAISSLNKLIASLNSQLMDSNFLCRSYSMPTFCSNKRNHQSAITFRMSWLRATISLLTSVDNFISKLCRLNLLMSRPGDSDKYIRVMFKKTAASFEAVTATISQLRIVLIDADEVTLKELDETYLALNSAKICISLIAKNGTAIPATSAAELKAVMEQLAKKPSLSAIWSCLKKLSTSIAALSQPQGLERLLENFGILVIEVCRNFAKLPPMFFYTSQNTIIQLSLNPVPQIPGEPMIMLQDTAFILKVEGIVEQKSTSSKVGLRHRIKHVCIKADLCAKSVDCNSKQPLISLEVKELVVNDFFCAEFSFLPECTDFFVIRVNIEAIDEGGLRWKVNCSGNDTLHDQSPCIFLKTVSQLIRTPSHASNSSAGMKIGTKMTS